jgi:hypothetical protein
MKYEDIMTKPRQMLPKLYNFMGTSKYLQNAFDYLESHNSTIIQLNPDPVAAMAKMLTKKALKMSLIQRKIRLETKWRHGQIAKTEYEKAVQNSSYVPQGNSDEEQNARIRNYFSTFRSAKFNYDHWRQELNATVQKDILNNSDCQKVLRLLSYEL